ncbi:MAG: sigma-70 family RNA polymerase sigma factor [Archangiaceae bacterium]|nr:sigma-70 family RNA polymerase sigma factor [Archangiaceae bacterium]
MGVAPDAFVRHLAERVGAAPVVPTLSGLHAADLLLAYACLHGSQPALAELETRLLAPLVRSLARKAGSTSVAEDVVQTLRERLLVGKGGAPGLHSYNGSGSLQNWLKVTALRQLLKLQTRSGAQVAEADELAERAAPSGDVELGHLKRSLRPAFGTAFTAALEHLTAHQRIVLRQRFLDGLSLDELARLHGTHRATISRWLAQIRAQLVDEVHLLLRTRLELSDAEAQSVMRLVHSQLEVSIGDYL